MNDFLTGYRPIETQPILQPNIAVVGQIKYGMAGIATHRPANIFTNAIMVAPPIGYSEQNPTVINVTAPRKQVTNGVGAIKASDAPTKGCKR